MKDNFDLFNSNSIIHLLKSGIILILILYCCNVSYAGDQQIQAARPTDAMATNETTHSRKIVDSSIRSISLEMSSLLQQPHISKADSLRLRELTSRLTLINDIVQNSNLDNIPKKGIFQQDELSISILAFGLLLILSILIFQFRDKGGINYMTFKLLGVIFIGTVSVFLIPAGYASEQITPVVGLLGTLAGYLIGSSRSTTQEPIETNETSSTKTTSGAATLKT